LCVCVKSVGVGNTAPTHASMMVGSIPVLVAVIAALWHRSRIALQAWAGLVVSLVGVAVVAGGGGGPASRSGDGLVLLSLAVSAAMTVAQVRMLEGRDPMAVTAVQFAAAAVTALPIALVSEGAPPGVGSAAPVVGVLALSVVGTMLPWVLFAFGQARVPAVVAGAFINIEPLIGAGAAALFFGETITLAQVGAGLAILTGVALSTLAAAQPAPAERGGAVEPVELEPEPVRLPRVPRLPRQRRRTALAWHLEDISADRLVLDRAA
jgi:O-acetylserine/cysteine efflux transporter